MVSLEQALYLNFFKETDLHDRYITQVLRAIKQVLRFPRENLGNYELPAFDIPSVHTIASNKAKLDSLRKVIGLVLGEVKNEIMQLNSELVSSNSSQTVLDISKIFKIVLVVRFAKHSVTYYLLSATGSNI
jgi:hypothetical protein